jgi:pantetheine-phosphate adenylyltransferase
MKNRAVYAGSFDPITFGHIDIVNRACAIFPELIVGVVEKSRKNTLFDIHDRVEMIKEIFKDNKQVRVKPFKGLLVDFLKENNSDVIVRGLRAVSDFEYEFQLALTNRKLMKNIDTIFLMPSEEYTYLSSSMVRELASAGGNTELFVPKIVAEKLNSKKLQ